MLLASPISFSPSREKPFREKAVGDSIAADSSITRLSNRDAIAYLAASLTRAVNRLKNLLNRENTMLDRKIYQYYTDGREVCIFLRDQQRWIECAKIVDLEGEVVTVRYETEEDEEVCSWEEMFRLDSIGSVTQKLASVMRRDYDLQIAEDCPEAEQIGEFRHPEDRE